MTNRRPYRLAAIVAGAGLLASCTSGGAEEETTPTTADETTASTADGYAIAYESPTAEDFNKLLTPTEGLTNLKQAEILNVDNGTSGAGGSESSALVISFEMESHYCFGVQTAVTESDNEVIIEILTGQLPSIDPTSCEYGIYPYTTEIALSAPVGERTIVPAEPREPAELATPDGETSTGGINDSTPTDGTTATTDGTGDSGTDNTDGGDNTGDENAGGDTTAQTTVTTAATPPNEQTGTPTPVNGAASLIGKFVEEGVEWALDNGLEWRVLTFDGVPFAEETPFNPERISFVVEADRIVRYEWS